MRMLLIVGAMSWLIWYMFAAANDARNAKCESITLSTIVQILEQHAGVVITAVFVATVLIDGKKVSKK